MPALDSVKEPEKMLFDRDLLIQIRTLESLYTRAADGIKCVSINYIPYAFGSDLVDKVMLNGEII